MLLLADEARAILAFLSHFNWYHFGLVYRYSDIYYSTLAEELIQLLNQPPFSSQFECTCKHSYLTENKTGKADSGACTFRLI